ncbi:uncharacterized protein BDR25DRAFT_356845 [Lindgomyces ingoldianus]|uniref:Uncharacterized protein n=1 Tax=Lindgomyces ingoldianus TaxID=673940 RepID=A0ACB6QS05_9PLEO|nr:uncharacterized protein BDR25DRAFT_356845 [Lindgomyces ingoldianus]KAF2469077.1 hypothetical protein BDR25DRAFT_356845 [Lindgomyces ingoldianus]
MRQYHLESLQKDRGETSAGQIQCASRVMCPLLAPTFPPGDGCDAGSGQRRREQQFHLQVNIISEASITKEALWNFLTGYYAECWREVVLGVHVASVSFQAVLEWGYHLRGARSRTNKVVAKVWMTTEAKHGSKLQHQAYPSTLTSSSDHIIRLL